MVRNIISLRRKSENLSKNNEVNFMYDNKTEDIPVKTVLACVDTGEFDAEISIKELAELAQTANAEVVGEIIQKKQSYDPATCMGSGRLEELKEQLEILEAELVIFDHELTGIQVRNIEKILDFFHQWVYNTQCRLALDEFYC